MQNSHAAKCLQMHRGHWAVAGRLVDGVGLSLSLSGGFTPSRHLRPSSYGVGRLGDNSLP